ncbi:MFS transporter [Actinomycetospora sp. DW7H6]|uniref:MFS transporter n=1 Tax=Actinomycetospora lemnae TaxID=3019891 RepID=A0ABT5T0A4_9PSEU|nr:MFS transporter [Actinomycetospora sp. DW7H6]MDD7967816.1 MFS transporter [Actinomycetospora sp. DW7H6]
MLVTAQILSGAGLAAGITVGALLAERMLGSTSLAGLPAALFTLGSALAALVVGRISQARGRRPGLSLGYGAGALGALGVVVAAALDSPVLLFVTLFVYGAGTATNLQARYAGADLAHPDRRGRAISIVLLATTAGGVAGPNLATATDAVATGVGLPSLTGPFVLAALAYGAAAVVLAALLRPDPLLTARARPTAPTPPGPAGGDATEAARTGETSPGGPGPTTGRSRSSVWSPPVLAGATTMIVTQLVMVAIMTMTPVHIISHGHGVAAAGLVIGVHVAAMYLLSPLSGWIVDRWGSPAAAVLAGIVLLASGLLAALAPTDSLVALTVALALLGLGWSLGLLSGTTALARALDPDTRARTQGNVDVAVAFAGAGGGLGSGLMVASAGYPTLALTGGLLAVITLLTAAATSRPRSRPATSPLQPPGRVGGPGE